MASDRRLVEPRNVSLYPSDWGIVEAADTYDAGISATLRRIIREWHKHRNAPASKLVDEGEPYRTKEPA